MKKAKLTKLAVLFLMISFVISCIVACQPQEQDLVKRFEETMANEDGNVAFSANEIIGHVSLSAQFSLDVSVRNGVVYVNNDAYDKITYIEDFTLEYEKALYSGVGNFNSSDETLEKIANHKGVYMLEATSEDAKEVKYVVCEIEKSFYFLSLSSNNELYRVHLAAMP